MWPFEHEEDTEAMWCVSLIIQGWKTNHHVLLLMIKWPAFVVFLVLDMHPFHLGWQCFCFINGKAKAVCILSISILLNHICSLHALASQVFGICWESKFLAAFSKFRFHGMENMQKYHWFLNGCKALVTSWT